uniref:Uncharacterized protein n=1 Tax=Cannabis sativa TaxID=3483 RepID=A0A803NRZ1_CANSA
MRVENKNGLLKKNRKPEEDRSKDVVPWPNEFHPIIKGWKVKRKAPMPCPITLNSFQALSMPSSGEEDQVVLPVQREQEVLMTDQENTRGRKHLLNQMDKIII